ncbi:uri1, prefoldin-like chaperone [Mortierella sp. GBA30]|nr:uri1, prefoldin-like chaperone [Mortierella sp. GBA30]
MNQTQSADRQEEAAELAKYFSKFSAALTRLDEELARWKNYEADYQALKTTLLDLPKETSHPVMVPIGNLAFMPGKLIHTNEVLVMLGDNWFVDRSAVQAAEIIDRRMELVQENITKLKAQEDEIRNKSGMAPGLLGGQEYNEEGLPIVEITEPYYSDDEEEKDTKAVQPGLLPFSQKTPKEQAEDRAILDRIAELEREDEERERRREAGEIVTSDEETESDEDEDIDYDDGESEDEFRPKALDSDEEYEEEVWEHSGNEDEDEDEDIDAQGRANTASSSSSKKSVRFADQVAKATKSIRSGQPKVGTGASATTAPSATKPKSPTDLYNQMRARQQAVRSASGSEQMVSMANLESTFANMVTTPSGSLGKAPVFETTTTTVVESENAAAPLKSALKPPPKKVSLFKQSRAASTQNEVQEQEPTVTKPRAADSDDQQTKTDTPPKKLSKFAMDRAAAAAKSTEAAPAKPTVGGVSERVFERNVVSPALSKQTTTPGVSEVVERSVVQPVKEAAPATTVATAPAPPSIVGVKDVIANTFTKPSSSLTNAEEPPKQPGRKKTSLFRRQQQQQTASYLEPEPAVPESSFLKGGVSDNEEDTFVRPRTSVPEVVSRSAATMAGALGSITERKPPAVSEGSSSSSPSLSSTSSKADAPALRAIPVVASAKLKDTPLMKGAIIEHETIEPVDEDELEDDMLMRQVVSEYQERRQAMIAKHGAFNREEIERLWEQQVVIPPGMIIPGDNIESIEDRYEVYEDAEETEDENEDEEEETEDKEAVVDDRNVPPKKLSLFRASRLAGTLAKQ